MKLFAFQPQGFGEHSFFVMKETLQEAKDEVEEWAKEEYGSGWKKTTEMYGWGTDYYKATMANEGEIITNDNG